MDLFASDDESAVSAAKPAMVKPAAKSAKGGKAKKGDTKKADTTKPAAVEEPFFSSSFFLTLKKVEKFYLRGGMGCARFLY